MTTQDIVNNHIPLTLLGGDDLFLDSAAAVMDLLGSIKYGRETRGFVLPKEAFPETFFDLRSGLLGEILQKCINYDFRLGIYGDFSGYTSKALRDFIYESNKGKNFYFVATTQEAIDKLSQNA